MIEQTSRIHGKGLHRVHPDYPPRARLERAIASARVVLAAGASLAAHSTANG